MKWRSGAAAKRSERQTDKIKNRWAYFVDQLYCSVMWVVHRHSPAGPPDVPYLISNCNSGEHIWKQVWLGEFWFPDCRTSFFLLLFFLGGGHGMVHSNTGAEGILFSEEPAGIKGMRVFRGDACILLNQFNLVHSDVLMSKSNAQVRWFTTAWR